MRNFHVLPARNLPESTPASDPLPPTDDDNSQHLATWTPDVGSAENWYKCHGMPCDKWRRMKYKMKVLKVIDSLTSEAEKQQVLDNLQQVIDVSTCALVVESIHLLTMYRIV